MKGKITIKKSTDSTIIPKCPKCEKEINEFVSVPIQGKWYSFNETSIVVCPHCHVVLGYGVVNYF